MQMRALDAFHILRSPSGLLDTLQVTHYQGTATYSWKRILRVPSFFKKVLTHFQKIIPILQYLPPEHQNRGKVFTQNYALPRPKAMLSEHLQASPVSKGLWGCSSGNTTALHKFILTPDLSTEVLSRIILTPLLNFELIFRKGKFIIHSPFKNNTNQ